MLDIQMPHTHYAIDTGKPPLSVYLEPTDLPAGVRLSLGDRFGDSYQVSQQGTVVYLPVAEPPRSQLVWVDRAGR